MVRGRLWRCSDPALDAGRRSRLVAALMRARRALRDVQGDAARRRARTAVDRAKRALGERGKAWWSDGAPDYNRHLAKNTPYAGWYTDLSAPRRMTARHISQTVLGTLRERAPTASACPSEIARRLVAGEEGDWRALMPRVREVVADLGKRGRVIVTRGKRHLAPAQLGGGPIRIRRGPKF